MMFPMFNTLSICYYITFCLTGPEAKVQNGSKQSRNSCEWPFDTYMTYIIHTHPVCFRYHASLVCNIVMKEAYAEKVLEVIPHCDCSPVQGANMFMQ